jgi:hypothetical protein
MTEKQNPEPLYKLDVVKVTGGGAQWAMRMTVDGVSRYRPYHYKRDALNQMYEWNNLNWFAIEREFNHNFDLAETLGIKEV